MQVGQSGGKREGKGFLCERRAQAQRADAWTASLGRDRSPGLCPLH